MNIFFDVDGVLVEGWHADPALRKPWSVNMEVDLGVNAEAFELKLFAPAADGAASLMHLCVTDQLDLITALESILPSLGYSASAQSFLDYWLAKDSRINTALFELIDALKQLPQVRLYIATNQEHHRAHYLWHKLGFKAHFDDMFYSAKLGVTKHDVRYFEAVNRSLDVKLGPEAAEQARPLFFDDTPMIVETALAMGWHGVIYNGIDDVSKHPVIEALLSGGALSGGAVRL